MYEVNEQNVDFVIVAGENVCRLERDSGPCGDAISQWYYDMASTQCKLFTFGGCRGNG